MEILSKKYCDIIFSLYRPALGYIHLQLYLHNYNNNINVTNVLTVFSHTFLFFGGYHSQEKNTEIS